MKITEFPNAKKLTSDNVFLIDGTNGTKNIFVGDAIIAMLGMTSTNLHRSIFRGKYLGASVTTEQTAHIQDGTFEDLWLGDYWTINGYDWVIGDFDYWYNTGDTVFLKHHLLIVPRKSLYNAQMNTTNVTTGAYVGSAMYTSNLGNAKTIINNAFGSKVLTHREHLTNAVSNGYPSGSAWYDSTVELMTECMVYGHLSFSPTPTGSIIPSIYTIDKMQIALFQFAPTVLSIRETIWLRDIVSASNFADVDSAGYADCFSASYSFGVRPAFCIG